MVCVWVWVCLCRCVWCVCVCVCVCSECLEFCSCAEFNRFYARTNVRYGHPLTHKRKVWTPLRAVLPNVKSSQISHCKQHLNCDRQTTRSTPVGLYRDSLLQLAVLPRVRLVLIVCVAVGEDVNRESGLYWGQEKLVR